MTGMLGSAILIVLKEAKGEPIDTNELIERLEKKIPSFEGKLNLWDTSEACHRLIKDGYPIKYKSYPTDEGLAPVEIWRYKHK